MDLDQAQIVRLDIFRELIRENPYDSDRDLAVAVVDFAEVVLTGKVPAPKADTGND